MPNRFWVGGTATWDALSTANWSATSGGVAGASVPGSADTAFFDANSGVNTVTLAYAPTLGGLNLGNFPGTLNFNSNVISLVFNGATIFAGGSTATLIGTPTINCTYSGSVGTRTISIGALGENNAVNVNITAGTDIISLITTNGAYKTVNFTGFSGSLSLGASILVFGDLILSPGMTVNASSSSVSFRATSGTQQITTNGKTLDFPVTQNTPGATVQLQDNLTMGSTRTFTLTAGTLDLASRTLSTGIFSSSNSNVRSIAFGTGNITVTGNAATVMTIDNGTNFSYTGAPDFYFTYSGSTGTRNILGSQPTNGGTESNAVNVYVTAGLDAVAIGGANRVYKTIDLTGFSGTFNALSRQVYGNFTLSATTTVGAGSGFSFNATSGTQLVTLNGVTLLFNLAINAPGATVRFQDALTLGASNTLTLTNGTVQLKNGVTSTVGAFATSGTSQKFLQSTTPGSQATLSQASGTVTASNLTIRDINAVGGATWNAFVDQGNVDAGNNDGWDFGISPVIGGAEYTYQLRSFTQPRRF